MGKVIIASKNPVKISATKGGFEKMFPEEKFTFEGVTVDSGVSNQPIGEKETLAGATNRVNNAKENFQMLTIGLVSRVE